MSVESENVKAMVRWALKLCAGPMAETVPLNAIDAMVDRSETSKGQLVQIKEALQDRLPAEGVATENTLEALRVLMSNVITVGKLWTKDQDAYNKIEELRALLAQSSDVNFLRVRDADNLAKMNDVIAALNDIKGSAGAYFVDRSTNLGVSEVFASTARNLWATGSGVLNAYDRTKEFKVLVISTNNFSFRMYESLDGVAWHQTSSQGGALINSRYVLRVSINPVMPWVKYEVTNSAAVTTAFAAASIATGR